MSRLRKGAIVLAKAAKNKQEHINDDSERPFPFFDLPRELRDQIYEEALEFKQKLPSQHGARLRGRRLIVPHLLLVSKQFSREYMERAESKSTLVIVDRNIFHGEMLKLPTQLNYVRNLELHLAIACDAPFHFESEGCRVLKEIRMHRKWIIDLCQQMRHLDSVILKLVIDPHKEVKQCEQKLLEMQYRLTNFDELTSLEVFHCDYAGKSLGGDWNFARERKRVMKWSKVDGTLHEAKGLPVKVSVEELKSDAEVEGAVVATESEAASQ